jgi:hypothetical protein
LVALGFVLIYKASGIFNYAQGVMALFSAMTLVGIMEGQVPFSHLINAMLGTHVHHFGWHLPAVLGILLTMVVMVGLAWLVQVVIFRHLVNQEPPNPNANKRRLSYINSMERHGLESSIFSVDGESWNFEEIGYSRGKELISSKDITNGTVLFTNDRLAIGFLAAAYEMGLRVGRGNGCALRVAGHDNHPYSRFTCPALTTVSHDYDAISRTSVTRLFDLLENREGGDSTDEQLFPGKLIMRDSA